MIMKLNTTLIALLSIVGIVAIIFIVLYFTKKNSTTICRETSHSCTLSKQQIERIKKEFTTNKELNMLIQVNNKLVNISGGLIKHKDSKWLNDFYTKNQFEINNVFTLGPI